MTTKTEVTAKKRKPHPYREAMRKLTNEHIDVDMLEAKLDDAKRRLKNAEAECEKHKPGPGPDVKEEVPPTMPDND